MHYTIRFQYTVEAEVTVEADDEPTARRMFSERQPELIEHAEHLNEYVTKLLTVTAKRRERPRC